MRAPSVKALLAAFPKDLDVDKAKLIRQIAAATDDADGLKKLIDERCPETAAYASSCHGDPFRPQIWRVTMALYAIDKILGTFGVEGLGPPRSGDHAPPFEYLNTGDPYTTTLVYKRKTDRLTIGRWGDIVEKHPEWE